MVLGCQIQQMKMQDILYMSQILYETCEKHYLWEVSRFRQGHDSRMHDVSALIRRDATELSLSLSAM